MKVTPNLLRYFESGHWYDDVEIIMWRKAYIVRYLGKIMIS